MLKVRTDGEREAVAIGPRREEVVGDEVLAYPDMTRARMSALEHRELPPSGTHDDLLAPFLAPGTEAWEKYFDARKVVVQGRLDGHKYVSVTSNVCEALGGLVDSGGARVDAKTFGVVQLLTDVYLHDKFNMTPRMLADMRSLAIADTAVAAARLQTWVRQFEGYDRSVVTAGKYAGSWKWARDSLAAQAAAYPRSVASFEALVVGDLIFMYGPDGPSGWSVSGPLRCSAMVEQVHRMVAAADCHSVGFGLGMETCILAIDVYDGHDVVSPVRQLHYGPHSALPYFYADSTLAGMSSAGRERLIGLADAVLVVTNNDEPCASAVRVGPRHVLVNDHVLTRSSDLRIGGQRVVPTRQVTQDMWTAKLERASAPDWVYREPVVGEEVFLLYRRYDELQVSAMSRIASYALDAVSLDVVDSMVAGVSGAAVVAASDFSLLGLYEGRSLSHGLATVFTSAMYTDLCTADESDLGSRASDDEPGVGARVYGAMKQRGFGKAIDAAVASVQPLYSDYVHVGMAQCWGGQARTVCDPDIAPLCVGSSGGQPLVFSGPSGGWYTAESHVSAAPPVHRRAPVYGESVFLVGKDSEGGYFSTTLAKVVHVGADARFFQTAGFKVDGALPLHGALVMAERDAAVLGAYVGERAGRGSSGVLGHCLAIPRDAVVSASVPVAERVQRALPFLKVALWPAGLVEEAVTHSSALTGGSQAGGLSGLAMIGDSALRTLAFSKMRECGLPPARWQAALQRDQSNAAMVEASVKAGLQGLLVVGGGLSPVPTSKVYADLVESLAGAIAEAEPSASLTTYAELVGALKTGYAVSDWEQ